MESGLGVRTPRQGIRILGLLVESGVIYILILIGVSSALVYEHRFSLFLLLQVTALASIPMIQDRMSDDLGLIFMRFWPVGVQLTVRNSL